MKSLTLALLGAGVLWLHLTMSPHLAVYGIRPNLILVGLMLTAFRGISPLSLVFAVGAGLTQDAMTHGMMGVYGLTFLMTVGVAYWVGRFLYEQNLLVQSLAIMGLTLVDGVITLVVLQFVEEDVPSFTWFFTRSFPVAIYHGALTPVFHWGLSKLDLLFERD